MRRKACWIATALTMLIAGSLPFVVRAQQTPGSFDEEIKAHLQRTFEEGRHIFRFDTFGDEAFWGDTLKLHQAIEGAGLGGVGPGVSPKTALAVGLKIHAWPLLAVAAVARRAGVVASAAGVLATGGVVFRLLPVRAVLSQIARGPDPQIS